MTLLRVVIWLISALVDDSESLRFGPVNWCAGTFLLAMALDLSSHPATRSIKPRT